MPDNNPYKPPESTVAPTRNAGLRMLRFAFRTGPELLLLGGAMLVAFLVMVAQAVHFLLAR